MAQRGGKAITAAQMRKIHVLAKDYGLDNDLLHVHIQTLTGKDSLKELSLGEAIRVIDSMDQKANNMTWKQKCLIDKLMQELGWTDEKGIPDDKRLDGFCSKYCGVDSHKWLTRRDASKVIEGLKNMLQNMQQKERAQKRAAADAVESVCGNEGGVDDERRPDQRT